MKALEDLHVAIWVRLKRFWFGLSKSQDSVCCKCAATIPFGRSAWYSYDLEAWVCRKCAPSQYHW